MDVSVIIVSWRVRECIEKCLTSIYQETKNLDFEIFVVDNDSRDGTTEMVINDFPQVHLIANNENFGFAHASNQAIKKSKGDFILLLNPDTEIINQAIEKTVEFMRHEPKAGIAGCKILNFDGSLQPSARRFPDLISHILILLKLHNFFPDLAPLRRYYMHNWPHNETHPVDQVMGAFFMVRRDVFKQIGLLDRHFYIWFEEVDFCQRARQAGWLTYFFAGSAIKHQKAQSFTQRAPLKLQLIYNRSLLYYFFKHKYIFAYLILLTLWPLSIFLTLIIQLSGLKKQTKSTY